MIDLDFECFKPIEPLWTTMNAFLPWSPNGIAGNMDWSKSSAMRHASVPRHPLFMRCKGHGIFMFKRHAPERFSLGDYWSYHAPAGS